MIRKTAKQREVMDLVFAAAAAGREISTAEVRKTLSYGVTRAALFCTVKYLVAEDFLQKRREGVDAFLKPTPKAYRVLRSV